LLVKIGRAIIETEKGIDETAKDILRDMIKEFD
jgi:hypothetical protein